MSASAIADGLVTMLGAASAFGSNAADNYKVLEGSSACCCVITWTGLVDEPAAFGARGGLRDRLWTFSVETYVKGKESPSLDIPHAQQVVDTVLSVLDADHTVLGTANDIKEMRGSRELPPEGYLVVSGQGWWRGIIEVDIEEWPNG